MNWITAIWSAIAGICLAFAGVHLLVWTKSRTSWANLFFSIAAASAAATALVELSLMHAPTPQAYDRLLRLSYVPLGLMIVSVAWFTHFYLKGRRVWLVWLLCSIRALVLVLGLTMDSSVHFREITGLYEIRFLREAVVLPIGVPNPWAFYGNATTLLLVVIAVDAAIAAWRRGHRRQAAVVGGTITGATVLGIMMSVMLAAGVLPMPYAASMVFLIIIVGIAYELSVDLLNVKGLACELHEKQERLKLAAKAASLGLWDYDVARDEFWVTDTIRSRLGFGAGERLTLERFLQRQNPDKLEATRQAIRDALDRGDEVEIEYRIADDTGPDRWVSALGRVERQADGRPLCVRGVSIDITNRKRAEEQLRQSEELLRTQFLNSPAVILVIERDYRIVMINRTETSLSPDEVKGRSCLDLLPPEHRDEARRRIDECFRTGRRQELEHQLVNGIWVWARLVRMGDGSAADRVVILSTDVTERRLTAERLRASAEFNEKVLASFRSHIAILDRNGTILAVNDAWKDFPLRNGAAPSGVGVGVNYLEACAHELGAGDVLAQRALTAIRSVLEGESELSEVEFPCSAPSEFRLFLMQVVPLKTSGGGAVVSHTEITQLRQAELQAEEFRHELSHVQRVSMLGQLASTLAHELNQPLGAILRNAEAGELLIKQDPLDASELAAILADIKHDDLRAGAVIDRMRLLLKRKEVEHGPVSIGELVVQVANITRSEVQARRATLKITCGAGLPPVWGDPIQLQQVILNLLVNGLDAVEGLPSDRRILTLRVEDRRDGTIEVAVSDTGPGIPREQEPRLFQPFNTTKQNGLGVGLAVSSAIIEAHGGRIWAENNLDGGATFRFFLKVAGRAGSVATQPGGQPAAN